MYISKCRKRRGKRLSIDFGCIIPKGNSMNEQSPEEKEGGGAQREEE